MSYKLRATTLPQKGVAEQESVRELVVAGHRPAKIAQHTLKSAADLSPEASKGDRRYKKRFSDRLAGSNPILEEKTSRENKAPSGPPGAGESKIYLCDHFIKN